MIRPAPQPEPTPPAAVAPPGLAGFRLLKPSDVTAALQLGSRRPDQVLRRLQEQGLRVLKIDGRLRVRPQDLDEFVAHVAEAAECKENSR